jgi:hypothetical protein
MASDGLWIRARPNVRVGQNEKQHEHMTPGFPLKADITGHSWRVSNVPEEEVRMRCFTRFVLRGRAIVDCLIKYCPSIAVADQERESQINPERLKSARTVAVPHYCARLNTTSSLVSGKTPSLVNFNSRSVSDVMVRFSVGSPT